MPIGPKGEKRPADVIGNAVHVMRIATGEVEDVTPSDGKDPAAKALGKKGGNARAKSEKFRRWPKLKPLVEGVPQKTQHQLEEALGQFTYLETLELVRRLDTGKDSDIARHIADVTKHCTMQSKEDKISWATKCEDEKKYIR